MARFPNPLATDFVEIAEYLVQLRGRSNLEQAAMRRAVSTAYYALFHALCYVCADGAVRWSRTDLVGKVYRSLEHGPARKKLAALAARADAATSLKIISSAFARLQDMRHEADYGAPASLFSRRDASAAIETAREAVDLVAAFDSDARRRLAVELVVVKQR